MSKKVDLRYGETSSSNINEEFRHEDEKSLVAGTKLGDHLSFLYAHYRDFAPGTKVVSSSDPIDFGARI